jgi:hypothetical protein
MPFPCRSANGLDCLSHLIYSAAVFDSLMPMPLPCHTTNMPFWKLPLKATAGSRRTAAIQQRVTAVLLSIPKEAFSGSFQKLYERYQPCVVKDGDCFEGQ